MNRFKGKKVLIVGVGKTGFKLIDFFSKFDCSIKVTDIKPIFDLNKQIKKLKRMPHIRGMVFGEHRRKDFLDADIIVHSCAVNPELPQLELAKKAGKSVYSEFALASMLCKKPIIAVCGSYGRTVVAHMIGFALKLDGKKVFVGGTEDTSFIEYATLPNKNEIECVIVEVSAVNMRRIRGFRPKTIVFTGLSEDYPKEHFDSASSYIEAKFSILKNLTNQHRLIVNYDKLVGHDRFQNLKCPVFWYSRRSFEKLGVEKKIQGTHFHNRRIQNNISGNSEFIVKTMRIIGQDNRENLLAAITVCKVLGVSDKAIQTCVEKFPGIPHRLEFLMEKNGVVFYNDSKSETMTALVRNIALFKSPPILIAGGKDIEEVEYTPYAQDLIKHARVLVLVGECKERMNRVLGKHPQTFIVGSFEESILLAYQKSRTGDVILLSPGNPASDFFRDYEERGNYYKKLVYQL